jgi:hypothetical protein
MIWIKYLFNSYQTIISIVIVAIGLAGASNKQINSLLLSCLVSESILIEGPLPGR